MVTKYRKYRLHSRVLVRFDFDEFTRTIQFKRATEASRPHETEQPRSKGVSSGPRGNSSVTFESHLQWLEHRTQDPEIVEPALVCVV